MGKVQDKLKEWKTLVEELNVQLHLGISESKDEFEKQKKRFRNLVNEASEQFNKYEHSSQENLTKLKSALENLRVQITLGKAETEDVLKEQQQKITKAILEFQNSIKVVYNTSEENTKIYYDTLNTQLDSFRTRFDLFRLHLQLGKADTKDIWDKKKKELATKFHEVKVKLGKEGEIANKKWDDFSAEMQQTWKEIHFLFSD